MALDTESASLNLFGKYLIKEKFSVITPMVNKELEKEVDHKSSDEMVKGLSSHDESQFNLKEQIDELDPLPKELPSDAHQNNSSHKKVDEVETATSTDEKSQKNPLEEPKEVVRINPLSPSTSKPKWQSLDKVTVLLSAEQKEGLDRVAKRIMKFRSDATKGSQDKERITANTLMRVLIDVFLEKENQLPMEVITNEETARKWVEKLFLPNS